MLRGEPVPGDRRSLAFALMTHACAVLLVGCSSAMPAPTPKVTTNEFGISGAEGCNPASRTLGLEVSGTPTRQGQSAYGEFQGVSPLILSADSVDVKLVVRVTGSGDLGVRLSDPAGVARPLDWGPDAHISSSYVRPGDEWGVELSFDQPGCWQLTLQRGTLSIASFWFNVG